MELPLIIAICSLAVAILALLRAFGVLREIYNYLRERKIPHKIEITFGSPEEKIEWREGYGLITIQVMLTNAMPHKSVRNIDGRFWTNEGIFVSSTKISPWKAVPNVPNLYFNFHIEMLHKKTSLLLSVLTLRVPRKRADYNLGYSLIADELDDWKHLGYQLKVENSKFKIHSK